MVPDYLTAIEWEDPLFPPPPPATMPPHLVAQVRSAFDHVPDWTHSLLWCPWVLEAMLDGILVPATHLDFDTISLVRLVVAQDNSCRYCYGTARMLLRILGYSDEFIRALEHDLAVDRDPRRRAALEYARLLSRANPRPGDGHVTALRELGFSADHVAELAAFGAIWVMETRITTMGALPPSSFETLSDRWWARLTRPLLARVFLGRARSVQPAVPDPARRVPVFDDLIGAFGELPVALSLRKIVDAVFGEAPLPRRTRVILCAVIGRALGCEATERQLSALLGPGDPSWADIDAMLPRLDADWLDDRERLLISVARETARFPHPRVLQRRMSELRQRLTPAEFVDFVGLTAVANGLGRLGVVLQRC